MNPTFKSALILGDSPNMTKVSWPDAEPLPLHVWAALAGCTSLLLGEYSMAAAQTYEIWEAEAASGSRILFRTLSKHVIYETRAAGDMVVLMVLSLGLALRGRRVLLLGPVAALVLTPAAVTTYQHSSDVEIPILRNTYSFIAFYHGAWISSLKTGIR